MNDAATANEGWPRPMSLEQWADLPGDEAGELVDGLLVEEEMPTVIHEALVVWLSTILMNWLAPRGGLVLGSEAKYAVTARRGRKSDLSVYFPGRLPPGNAALVELPPDIAVEVISPKPRDERRDRVEKVGDYAAFGVRFYWLVDPELRTLEILELGSDRRYVHALGATGGVLTAVPGCEGLTIDLTALWAEVDRLAATRQ